MTSQKTITVEDAVTLERLTKKYGGSFMFAEAAVTGNYPNAWVHYTDGVYVESIKTGYARFPADPWLAREIVMVSKFIPGSWAPPVETNTTSSETKEPAIRT